MLILSQEIIVVNRKKLFEVFLPVSGAENPPANHFCVRKG
jgi:hypothetical protein